MFVITNPEITKKTSTPTKPPGTGRPAWKATTASTASARRPWMSGRRLTGWISAAGGPCDSVSGMTDELPEPETVPEQKPDHEPPKGSETSATWEAAGRTI